MSTGTQTNRQLQNRASLGIILMIIGLALYPLSDGFIKHLMGTYSFYQTSFLRAAIRLIPLFISVYFQGGVKEVLATRHPGKHIIRLIISFIYTASFMFALSQVPLTTIYTLSYTSSLFMIILSAVFLKEHISWDRWAAVIMGMVGVIIAMRPGSNLFEMAALIVLAGTFLGALQKILIRDLAKTEHSLSIAIYPNIVMLLICFPKMLTSWISMPLEHWALFAIVGVMTAAAQYAMAQALRFAPTSTLAPIDYSTYFWVVALDALWWNKKPDQFMVIGAIIIVMSNLYILYRTRLAQKKSLPSQLSS
ncbi:MAG: DMT family transporter [Candidatus Rhabdochlamydia sp.]